MTSKKSGSPIEIVKLRDENNNIYSELLNLYNVYIPDVTESRSGIIDKSLIIFS